MIAHFAPRTSRAIAASAIAIAATAVAVPALAANPMAPTAAAHPGAHAQKVTMSEGWIDQDMAQLTDSSGRLLRKRISAAETKINAGQYLAANNELDAAQDTAGAIKAMMPFVVAVDRIKTAKNELITGDVERFREDLLPIYAHLEQMAVFAPKVSSTAQSELKQAENDAVTGKTKQASETMDAVSKTITASTVYLPVEYVYGQIAAARVALSGAKPDVATAKKAVNNAEKKLAAVMTTTAKTQQS